MPASDLAKAVTVRQLAENLWCADATLPGRPIPIRMTVIRLVDGRLVLYSPIQLDEDRAVELEWLGPVRFVVVPNTMHRTFVGWAARRFPEARILAARHVLATVRGDADRADAIEEVEDEALRREIDVMAVAGSKVGEVLLLHRASRSLLLADLCFNLAGHYRGFMAVFMRWNGVADRLAMSRLYRWFTVQDAAALRRSIEAIAALDFRRLIVCHGRVIEKSGRDDFRRAFGLPPE